MKPPEPNLNWQHQIHEHILSEDDPTAFAALCEHALEYLIVYIQESGLTDDVQLCTNVVTDLLMKYAENPKQYDPEKLSLFAYFRMAVRGDIKNELDKLKRKNKKIIEFDDPNVELQLEDRNNIQEHIELREWLEAETGLTLEALREELRELLDPTEFEVVELWIIEGIRDTSAYVQLLQITEMDEQEQRKEVKRIKDRVMKKLERYGARKRKA